jgi:hypothetical protein
MDTEVRSRVWLITYPWSNPDQDITIKDIPGLCSEFLHAKYSYIQGTVSIFIRYKSLKSAGWISNLIDLDDLVIIKKSNWEKYKSFQDIPFTWEHIQDNGAAEHIHISGNTTEDKSDTLLHSDQRSDGYGTDEYLSDVQFWRTSRKRIRALDEEYKQIEDQLVQVSKRIRPWAADQLDL